MDNGFMLSSAIGAMKCILNKQSVDIAKGMGCTNSQWEKLTGPNVWDGADRRVCKRLIDQLVYGVIDQLGLPRFSMPCEFIASVGVAFCHPVNWRLFAAWTSAESYRTHELGGFDGRNEPDEGYEAVKPSQMFPLMLTLASNDECQYLMRRFKDKCPDFNLGGLDEKKPKS